MPVSDKVKSQAAQLAQAAQEAGKAGQSRLAEAQARKRADEMLRGLGRAVLASRTGRATDGTEVEIEQLLSIIGKAVPDLGAESIRALFAGLLLFPWVGSIGLGGFTDGAPSPERLNPRANERSGVRRNRRGNPCLHRPGLSRGKRSAERGHGAKRSPAATLDGSEPSPPTLRAEVEGGRLEP